MVYHLPIIFNERPIVERPDERYAFHLPRRLRQAAAVDAEGNPIPMDDGCRLQVKISGPAFDIDPRELSVPLVDASSVDFLITPKKSGKHLLRVDFYDAESELRGYFTTTIRVKDYVLLRYVTLTEAQVKILGGHFKTGQ